MNKITEILKEKSEKAKSRFETEIHNQKIELEAAKTRVFNNLLGLDTCSRFSIREQFTYVAKVEETVNCMLHFYREIYGFDYEDPKPTEEIVAI